jgi:hypothetical protein
MAYGLLNARVMNGKQPKSPTKRSSCPDRAWAVTLVFASAASSLACAQSGSSVTEDAGTSGPTPAPVGTPVATPPSPWPSGNWDSGAPSPAPVQPGCAGTKLVYLVSDSNEMYSFDPAALTVVDLGSFSCPGEPTPNPDTGSGAANSMAVDRNGTAWVNFQDGRIFQLNTGSLNCTSTSFQSGQSGFSLDLGMAFVSDGAGSGSETLYVSDNGGQGTSKGLAWIDVSTMTLNPIGAYTGVTAGYDAELTGTPGGTLYGVFSTSPASLAQIDEQTGATSNVVYLDAVSTSGGSPSCDANAWVYMGNDPNACDGLIGESCGWTWDNEGQGYHCATTSWGTGCEPGGVTCTAGGGYAMSCDPNAWVYMGNNANACDGLIGESCGWTWDNEGQGYHCVTTSWGTDCESGGAACPAGGGNAMSCDPNAWVYMGNNANACDGLIGESCGWTWDDEGQGYHCAATSWGTGCEPGGASCPMGGGGGTVSGGDYAMAYSGGKFWLFTASTATGNSSSTTTITQYDPVADQTSAVSTSIDDSIVGAGVSTCVQ